MKKTLFLTIFFVFALSINVCAKDIRVTIDGKEIEFDDYLGRPFVDENSRTLLPVRVVMEQLGYEVEWKQETQSIIINSPYNYLRMNIGSNYIGSWTMEKKMDTCPVIISERTYLPIRYVIEAFGGIVNWNQETQTVEISSVKGFDTIKDPLLVDKPYVRVDYDGKTYYTYAKCVDNCMANFLVKMNDAMRHGITAFDLWEDNKYNESILELAEIYNTLYTFKILETDDIKSTIEMKTRLDKFLKDFASDVYYANESTSNTAKKQKISNAWKTFYDYTQDYDAISKKFNGEIANVFDEYNIKD